MDRAKIAYAKQKTEKDVRAPSPSPDGDGSPSRAPIAYSRGKEVPDIAVPITSKGPTTATTDHLTAEREVNLLEVAKKAKKAEKVSKSSLTTSGINYTLIDTDDELDPLVENLKHARMIGLDLETTGLCWWQDRIRIVSITTEAGKTFLVDAFKVDITPMLPALEGTKIVAHNALFDALFLRRSGFWSQEYICTKILSQILWAGKLKPGTDKNVEHDLVSVAKRALNLELDKSHQNDDWSGILSSEMLDYAARDSEVLLPLHEELTKLIEKAGDMSWVVDLETRLLNAMVHISDSGLPVDPSKWAEYIELVEEEKASLATAMDDFVTQPLPDRYMKANKKKTGREGKINWQSSEQAAWVIEKCHGFTLPLTEKGKPSTGKDALKTIDHPLADLLRRFNQIKNVPATFGRALDERYAEGRIYASWNQCEAGTGRMSCANPPLQGIPSTGDLRKAIVAPEGYRLVVSDLSQIEIRVLAALSEDQNLIDAFEAGADVHRSVAATVLGKGPEEVTDEERKIAKSIVFGQMYGQGVDGLRGTIENRLGRKFSKAEAREYWERFFDAYPGVKRWREKEGTTFDAGYRYTRTRKGRRRLDVDSKPKRWNSPIQGLAADVLKAIAVTAYERREEILGLEIVGLVHDEVILLVPEEHADRAARWLTEIMEETGDSVVNEDRPTEDRVMIKADTSVCDSWGDKA